MLSTRHLFPAILFLASLDLGAFIAPDNANIAKQESIRSNMSVSYLTDYYWLGIRFINQRSQEAPTTDIERFFLLNFGGEDNYNKTLERELYSGSILNDNWEDMRVLFPYFLNATDKRGRPLLYIDMNQWNVGSYLTDHESWERFLRYIIMVCADAADHVNKLRANGENVDQFSSLINFDGMTTEKHFCEECVRFYRNKFPTFLSAFIADNCKRAVGIHVPKSFAFISASAQKYFGKNFVKLFLKNDKGMKNGVLCYFSQDQIPLNILDSVV